MDSLKKLLRGDKRAIAQTISMVENDTDTKILEKIFPHTGKAYHVGITGPPGAGKSTLVNAIAKQLLQQNKKIGVIAVDPTSPFSGGALLGDRVRMNDLALQENCYIRSMASRGSLGGLAQKTKDVALILDASGMDYILIETIGVGQVELDIAQVCDTTVVVLVPESGDSIQAMKAGLLEIADIIVVNKGDREGCESIIMELKFALELRQHKGVWHYPIVKTIATEGVGIDELVYTIQQHKEYLEKSGRFQQTRKEKLRLHIHEVIEENIKTHLKEHVIKHDELEKIIDKIYERKLNLYHVADELTKKVLTGSGLNI
jgi:LAO/AO transport system kinase